MANSDFSLLIVDDEEMNRDMLSRRLERLGYRAVPAEGGAQALELLRAQSFDLVLLDVMMPDMDGLEVLTTIRETHSIGELPVIMVTAREQSGDVVAALQMGANDYVTKPVNFPLLLARIQTQLAVMSSRCKMASASVGGTGTEHDTLRGRDTRDTRILSGPSPRAEPGAAPRLVADYEIIGELGRGGMGVVYKARHQRMNRLVALKLIDRAHLAHADAVRRFYQEIQAAAQLAHANVVIAYDAGEADGTHFFAMEFVEGLDLAKLVEQHGPLGIEQGCDYIRQAALGLQHAHERGLVHRDIKPSNLLVTWSAKDRPEEVSVLTAAADPVLASKAIIKVLDLGLALIHQPVEWKGAADELTREGRIVGSVDYMAPEQWKNAHTVDIRADLYSLGCTFYYLLTGKVPYPGVEAMEKMLKHFLDEPTPLEQLRPEVPPKVAAIVRKLMAKNPDQRYQAPGELAELLKWHCQSMQIVKPSVRRPS